MKLLIHIGTGKTGSTSIQSALSANRAKLLSKGFFYSVCNDKNSHNFLPMLVADKGNFQFLFKRIFAPSELHHLEAKRQEWCENLRAEVEDARSQAHTFILSSEHLCTLNRGELRRLKGLVLSLFSSLEVLVYLRDQADYAVSMYDTSLKTGGPLRQPAPPERFPELNYAKFLKRWRRVVTKNAVNVRLFERESLLNGDILEDFFSVCGLSVSEFERPPEQNQSMDILGHALMHRINLLLPEFLKDGTVNPARRNFSRYFASRFSKGEKLTVSPALAAKYDSSFRSSNEWVRKRYFPNRESLFARKERRATGALGIPDEYLDEMAQTLVDLWRVRN
jgi:hypothetical protein